MYTNGVEEFKIEYELFPEKYATIYVDVNWMHQKEKMYTSNGDIGWDGTSSWEISHVSWGDIPHMFRDEKKVEEALKKMIERVGSDGLIIKK